MSNNVSRQKVDNVYAELQQNSKSASVRTKLSKVHNACEKISANAVVSVASVIRYISEDGVRLTKRTVYNDRAGGNPYKKLIEAWIAHSELTHSNKKVKPSKINTETSLSLIDEEDLVKIPDLSLRHKFSLMYGELKSLRNQVNILKDVGSLPILSQKQISHTSSDNEFLPSSKGRINLTDYERDVIEDFLNSTLTSLDFDDDGALVSRSVIKRNETLSMEGLRDILVKVLNG